MKALFLGTAIAVAVGATPLKAAELTVITAGDQNMVDYVNEYLAPLFEEKNPGVKVVMDSSGPSAGKIRTMVESKKVVWDLCDSSVTSSILLGGQGLLEPIDYAVVKKADILPQGFAYPHGAAPYSFSSVMLYDAEKFKIDPPKPVRAFLIENDWEKAKEGEEYLRQINPASAEVTAALKRLQSRHEGRVRKETPGRHRPRTRQYPRLDRIARDDAARGAGVVRCRREHVLLRRVPRAAPEEENRAHREIPAREAADRPRHLLAADPGHALAGRLEREHRHLIWVS